MMKPLAPTNKLDVRSDISITAKQRWQPLALADDSTINILDEIGDDWWSDSDTTLNRISKKLVAANGADIVVNINSFGGDMFEGLAIYNALREYSGKVTVKVLGLAASSASIIAMAGDEIQMSEASFLMIHNCWLIAAGNRHDFAALAEQIKPFDEAMASIYAAQTGLKVSEITAMMDDETWINGEKALEKGFATSLFEPKLQASADKQLNALRHVDSLLAKQGLPRSERRDLLKEIKGTHDAAESTHDAAESTHDAAQNELIAELKAVISTLK